MSVMFWDLGPTTQFKMPNNYKSSFVNGRIPESLILRAVSKDMVDFH